MEYDFHIARDIEDLALLFVLYGYISVQPLIINNINYCYLFLPMERESPVIQASSLCKHVFNLHNKHPPESSPKIMSRNLRTKRVKNRGVTEVMWVKDKATFSPGEREVPVPKKKGVKRRLPTSSTQRLAAEDPRERQEDIYAAEGSTASSHTQASSPRTVLTTGSSRGNVMMKVLLPDKNLTPLSPPPQNLPVNPEVLDALYNIKTTPFGHSFLSRLHGSRRFIPPGLVAVDWETRTPWMNVMADIREHYILAQSVFKSFLDL